MGFTVLSQEVKFAYSILFGASFALVYDFFRAFRIIFKQGHILTFASDFLYFIITAISFVIFIFVVNNGEIRIYMLISAVAGWLLFFFTIGIINAKFVTKCSLLSKKNTKKGLKK